MPHHTAQQQAELQRQHASHCAEVERIVRAHRAEVERLDAAAYAVRIERDYLRVVVARLTVELDALHAARARTVWSRLLDSVRQSVTVSQQQQEAQR